MALPCRPDIRARIERVAPTNRPLSSTSESVAIATVVIFVNLLWAKDLAGGSIIALVWNCQQRRACLPAAPQDGSILCSGLVSFGSPNWPFLSLGGDDRISVRSSHEAAYRSPPYLARASARTA